MLFNLYIFLCNVGSGKKLVANKSQFIDNYYSSTNHPIYNYAFAVTNYFTIDVLFIKFCVVC